MPGSPLDPDRWPEALRLTAVMGGLGSGVLAQIVRYRQASLPQQRQQTRWVVITLIGAVLGFGVLFVFLPRRWVPLPDLGKGVLVGVGADLP